MFICNHCPYVKAIIKELVKDINELKKNGIETVAIMSNDTKNYPEDSFVNMLSFSKMNSFNFPYLFDEKQEVAKKFGAVCTPDFFGYNKNLRLQYRGRFRELRELNPVKNGESELKSAMMMISKTQNGPKEQIPSMGCNINGLNNVCNINKKFSSRNRWNAKFNGWSIFVFIKTWAGKSICRKKL